MYQLTGGRSASSVDHVILGEAHPLGVACLEWFFNQATPAEILAMPLPVAEAGRRVDGMPARTKFPDAFTKLPFSLWPVGKREFYSRYVFHSHVYVFHSLVYVFHSGHGKLTLRLARAG